MKYSLFLVVLCVSYINARSVETYNETANTLNCPIYKGIQLERNNWTPMPIGECMKCKCINDLDDPNQSRGCLTCPEYQLNIIHGSPCYISKIDNSLQYPECCPKTVCPLKNNNIDN
ncbi:uncharacterized protein LOC123300170 [Chrysoperla carnea]|uniref:uncharacterized protein LOC123300170 n=1 Tax=Chrysoperla carnea TaxID=189513 RepID=UPI001D092417|nr:uncharacterized protein LOC123300170 [Chrysoperla carnea]